MNFAIARANEMGYTDKIREPEWKICPLCRMKFIESSLPMPLVERLGINNIDYCAPCLSKIVLQNSGKQNSTYDEIIEYLTKLSKVIEKVPTQSFSEGLNDFLGLEKQKRLELFIVLKDKPSIKRVKELLGSWLNALIKAEILPDCTRPTTFGTQTVAKDGHLCLSLGEKTIDDFLFEKNIPHEKEPKYPDSNFRADFIVNDVFIEYFGLKGDPEYDKRIKLKKKMCKDSGIHLIEIYPIDLTSDAKLAKKLNVFLWP